VWYDEHNLGAGQLLEEIQRELNARPVFVVLLSPDALASKWVQRECKWAYTVAPLASSGEQVLAISSRHTVAPDERFPRGFPSKGLSHLPASVNAAYHLCMRQLVVAAYLLIIACFLI
jgi:hypothetical protein